MADEDVNDVDELSREELRQMVFMFEAQPNRMSLYQEYKYPSGDARRVSITRKQYEEWKKGQRDMTSGVNVSAPKGAPHCKDHPGVVMRYDPMEEVFKCPEKNCDVIARRKSKGAEDFKGTIIRSDEIELVRDTSEDKYYLRFPKLDLMVDINPVIEPTGVGTLHGTTDEQLMTLRFPDLREVDSAAMA